MLLLPCEPEVAPSGNPATGGLIDSGISVSGEGCSGTCEASDVPLEGAEGRLDEESCTSPTPGGGDGGMFRSVVGC